MPKTEVQRVQVKTRDCQFENKLVEEYELSPREAESIVETARDVYDLQHYDPNQNKQNGQIVKTVVSKNAKHGPKLEDLPKTQVTLTKKISNEDKELYRQEDKPSLRQTQILRMTEEALEQGGLLTQEELADILEVSSRTIRRDINDLKQKGFEVTTRGVYQDIGPGLSHKTKIIKLYLEYNTYSDIRIKTKHSPSAIKRYIKNFGRVLLSNKKDLTLKETARIVGISEKLVKEYLELYMEYNTEENRDRIIDIVNKAQNNTSANSGVKKGAKK
ncbi:MAG: DUF1670 domain-containing protein [Halanaerobiales bacterium]